MLPKKKAKAIPSTSNDADQNNDDDHNRNDVIEIKNTSISEVISCGSSSGDEDLMFLNTSQINPKLKLKHIDLTEIMPDITDHKYIALTGSSLRKRHKSSISSISNKTNPNGKKNKNSRIIKMAKNNRSTKKTKDTSSNNTISKYFKPSLSTPIKVAETMTKSSSQPLSSPLAIIKKCKNIKTDKTICDNRLFLPPTKMISIPMYNLNMLDELTTYKIRNNNDIVIKNPLNQLEETICCDLAKRRIINNNNSCCDTTTLSTGEESSVPGNSLVSLDELTSNKLLQLQNISNTEIIEKKSSLKCPAYKIIEGTTFAVDGFRFGNIPGVTDYFLTHFHADHYVGLRKSFSYPLWTSSITARLVRDFIKVDEKYIRVLDTHDKPVCVNGVEICALEANHCPGAVMFLFKLPDGRNILHTGDFRASADMEMYPCFWSSSIDILYLDTTYLKKSYDFMSQIDSIDIVKYEVNKFLTKNVGNKYLIIIGSYIIGKEKVWKAVSECTEQKVWLDEKQLKASKHIFSPDTDKHILDMIVERKEDAAIHVLPLGKLSYQFLDAYLKDYENHVMLAIKVSGWQKNSKNSYGNRISIIGIEYSEHSSYSELERFVRFLKPKKVISTVPLAGNDLHICRNVPDEWISWNDLKPMVKSYQRDISSYFKKIKPVP